jgi:hypothetical protein
MQAFNSEENALMHRLHTSGIKWNYIHQYFPDRTDPASCKIEYLKLVADGFGARGMGDESSTKMRDWYKDFTLTNIISVQASVWPEHQLQVVMFLRDYGLTWYGVVEEIGRRGPNACEAVWQLTIRKHRSQNSCE